MDGFWRLTNSINPIAQGKKKEKRGKNAALLKNKKKCREQSEEANVER